MTSFFNCLSCLNFEKRKEVFLFAGVQLLEYGSVNHCTGLLLLELEIMRLTFFSFFGGGSEDTWIFSHIYTQAHTYTNTHLHTHTDKWVLLRI